jgi:hypothetical protein
VWARKLWLATAVETLLAQQLQEASVMIEVECPVSGKISEWPNRLALEVGLAQALSREFEIEMEDIMTMAKVTRELGSRWYADACEFQELLLRTECDKERLNTGGLSIIELEEIYLNAHRMLTLLRTHARGAKQRAKIDGYLRNLAAMREINFEAALPILHPEVKALLTREVN